ncbi:hypothetical protein [Nocardioides abyssi]|uniref:Collagen-like protein n=1 Tax=Nocardioides abyssi TaxID=3058370 RepID=A0ABT8EP85_9ACTN|nr:hypothetical protein [Nocardioides abyssi]MDN4159821.1 hypothetical protein [Nocardioides abyssi]
MRRPTPSFFISVAALVVATSGTSYAAMTIGSADIEDNSIRSQDVKDGTLKAKDFRPGQLPAGAQGPAGPAGADGADGAGRWLLVDASGAIVAQSGGFEIVTAYPTLANTAPAGSPDNALRANGNVYIDAGEDLSDNGILATVALQNTVDQNGDAVTSDRAPGADANPEFSGEINASLCSFPGATGIPTNCAPAGAQNNTSFVVSPRNSDGSVTTTTSRKRFYVVLTGDSSDYAAPTAP